MTLVKLKDINIAEISDTLDSYSVFQGTFHEGLDEKIYGMAFNLEDGRVVKMETYCDSYDSPNGFENPSKLIIELLRLVSEKGTEGMNLVDFIHWVSQFATGFNLTVKELSGDRVKLGRVQVAYYNKVSVYDLLERAEYTL